MDPKTGVAVVFGVQIARSMRDVEVYKVGTKLESTLYQGLKVVA